MFCVIRVKQFICCKYLYVLVCMSLRAIVRDGYGTMLTQKQPEVLQLDGVKADSVKGKYARALELDACVK